MVSKVEFETIDTRSLELESSISHMTIIFEVRTIYRLRKEVFKMNSTNFNKNLGKRILSERLLHNYTREYLAELADISPKFLYEIETGKKGCSSFVLYRLVKALDIKADSILFSEKDQASCNNLNDI